MSIKLLSLERISEVYSIDMCSKQSNHAHSHGWTDNYKQLLEEIKSILNRGKVPVLFEKENYAQINELVSRISKALESLSYDSLCNEELIRCIRIVSPLEVHAKLSHCFLVAAQLTNTNH